MGFQTSFTSYLLDDHYGVDDEDKQAAILGRIGFTGDCASVCFEFFLGYLIDAIGRKWPCTIGMAIAGVAFISQPLPSHVYALYIFRCIGNVGTLPMIISPFAVDYVHAED